VGFQVFIPDDGGSTHLWNVGRQLFYTAVHPRRQFWTSYHICIYKFIHELLIGQNAALYVFQTPLWLTITIKMPIIFPGLSLQEEHFLYLSFYTTGSLGQIDGRAVCYYELHVLRNEECECRLKTAGLGQGPMRFFYWIWNGNEISGHTDSVYNGTYQTSNYQLLKNWLQRGYSLPRKKFDATVYLMLPQTLTYLSSG
jgi:hypothetical protein